MKFRLPELKDEEIIKSYIEEHYSHNEKSLSASNKLTSMHFEDWVKKMKILCKKMKLIEIKNIII